jgi:hypothetical protein
MGHKKRADKSALFPFNLTLTKPMKKLSIFSYNKYTIGRMICIE